MTLFTICLNVIAKPEIIKMYANQLSLIPLNVKTILLKILCKRGLIKDVYVFKQLVNWKLTEMDLSECVVTDELLSCLHICKNLQKLDLSLRRRQPRCITNEALISLFPNLPCLKILAIPHCKEVDDEVIKTVCKNCTQLKELHIPNSSVTDASLHYIGQTLGQLYAFNILGTQITDAGIQYLTNGPLSQSLSEINMDKCPNTSPHSGTIVAKNCPNIKIFTCGSFGNDEELTVAIDGIRSKAKQIFWWELLVTDK